MRKKIGVTILYELKLRDEKGKVVKVKKGVCNSFVANFAKVLRAGFGNGTENLIDTGNVSRSVSFGSVGGATLVCRVNALSGDITYGLVIGTGTDAVTINDYKLQTIIAHGTGAGQLQYSGHTFGAPFTDATISYFTVIRAFTNASGNTITVNEIGIYANIYGEGHYFCIARDKLTEGISVPNGQSLTLTYTIKVTI